MKHSSIILKFSVVMLLTIGLIATAAYSLLNNVYRLQVRAQANTVADNVTSFGSWVAKYGRVWVGKNSEKSFLGKQTVVRTDKMDLVRADGLPRHAVTLYSKNPALAQREFSEVVANSESPAKFKLTSDNFMNPLNRPNEFELLAISSIRASGAKYFEQFDNEVGEYLFARVIVHKASCIKCHGDPAKAPADVIKRYGKQRGFGFKEGDVAGIISVRLPLTPFFTTVVRFIGWKEVLLVLSALALAAWFLQRSVLFPIRQLANLADAASEGRTAKLDLGDVKQDTSNEIERLGLAIKRLTASTNIAIDHWRRSRKA